ncbi:RING finger protein 141-like [Acipenser ruthenus]|uniref:RING finger protein 141-like n=1 Tax=Acipenser ruthenus TaxID=7906 RepID=UPI00145B3296|nr:RING finger protein 141-like [Acipenser ruthenus]
MHTLSGEFTFFCDTSFVLDKKHKLQKPNKATINNTTGTIESSRIMNLYQFIQLYKDITSQSAGVLALGATSEDLSLVSSCQASIWMGRSDHNRNCPICRLQVTAASESWIMSDAPTEHAIASYILNLADEAGLPHRP